MIGATPLLPLYAVVPWTRASLLSTIYKISDTYAVLTLDQCLDRGHYTAVCPRPTCEYSDLARTALRSLLTAKQTYVNGMIMIPSHQSLQLHTFSRDLG